MPLVARVPGVLWVAGVRLPGHQQHGVHGRRGISNGISGAGPEKGIWAQESLRRHVY